MRLIDADAFEANMQNEWERNEISNGEWIHFREMINNEPTIEAVTERKKGRWRGTNDAECNQCGHVYPFFIRWQNYCPNCGASMTEGAEDDPEERTDT